MKHFTALLLLPLALTALPALAQDGPPDTEPDNEICFPTQDITKQINKMEDLKASKRDTVRVFFEGSMSVPDGADYPERMEVRDGEVITDIQIDREKGETLNLQDTLRSASGDAEFCMIKPHRAEEGEEKSSFGLGMRVGFIDTPGNHTLAQIEDGLKDGRSHYKKMAGPMGFMVPKFSHVAIASDEEVPPRVFITANGTDLGEAEFELTDGAQLYPIKQIEAMGGDGLRIDGPYRMSPSPDAKTVARFTGGGSDKDDD